MLVSCICVCHNKPDIAHEAIQSIVNQSYPHWEALVVDSGVLYDSGYYDRFAWRRDPRVKLIRSEETDELRRTRAMAPWCFNACFRKGLVSGDLVMYLCDDDLLYANAFATFVAYCRKNSHVQAMYASQDLAVIYPNGWRAIVGERRATEPGGRCYHGRRMDCYVDYLQFCHKREILRLLAPDAYWPEDKETESHADGIFMERIGEQVPIYPIDVKVSQNRRTSRSTYVPVRSFNVIECLANGAPYGAAETPATAVDGQADCSLLSADGTPLVTISVVLQGPSLAGASGSEAAETLASVAAQTYPRLEVLVRADGAPAAGFEALKIRYPQYRFLDNAARRDRGLWQAHGHFFIPMDAGTLACPGMVERLVAGMRRNPGVSALACYVLAVREERYAAANLLASTKNLSSNGIFHTANFRKVGGYGIAGEITGQDWIGFHNLVNGGYPVDVLPEHLFYYPTTGVVRPFFEADRVLAAERVALWTALGKMQRRLEELTEQNITLQERNETLQARCGALRYRLADRLVTLWNRIPFAQQSMQWLRWATVGRYRRLGFSARPTALKASTPAHAACPR
jgi:glycosyltransferase involved in cell wall biosynthesis